MASSDRFGRYTADAWRVVEQDRLWPRVWLLAGRASDASRPGDRLVFDAGGLSALVVRGGDGALRAFHNACPHRGTRLCDRPESGSEIRCPYHQWRFALDGRLVEAPGLSSVVNATLAPIRVEVRHGFVWVALAPDLPPLREWLGPVDPLLGELELAGWGVVSNVSVDLECNWKTSVDAHNETYHVPYLHPEVLPWLDLSRSTVERLGLHARIVVPGRGRTDSVLHFVFPNVQINASGDECLVFRHRPDARDPERMTFDQVVLRRGSTAGAPVHRDVGIDDPAFGPVTSADLRIVRRVQRGMRTGIGGPLLTPGEACIAHLHAGLDAVIGAT
jgi:phenylpropionate dioxygenase-like ring-hydroxylating dioxygenase large terminal subunit